MPVIGITSDPKSIANGSVEVHVSSEELLETGVRIYYGFGDNKELVDTWHPYFPRINDPLNIQAGFGKVWIKAPIGVTAQLQYSLGV